MLNAFLSGIRGLDRCDGNRHVPDNRHPLLLRLINDCEVGIAWQTVVNFDTVRASLLEHVDCLPAFSGVADDNRWAMSSRLWSIYDWAAGDNARSHELQIGRASCRERV